MKSVSEHNILVPIILLCARCYAPDGVAPGYYGELSAGASGSSRAPAASSPLVAADAGKDGSAALATPPTATPISAAGARAQEASAPVGSCDLTGRWIVTTHTATDALGQLQYAHYYLYFDLEQRGNQFSVRKGLMCGTDAVGVGAFAVTADFSAARAATMRKLSFQGLTGTSASGASGCKVQIQKFYIVMGASLPYYLDPAHALPNVEDEATPDTPGWEDWDEDGQPGITGVISGVISGKVFTASRSWMVMAGDVQDVRAKFQLPVQWNAEPNVMAVDGSPLLASEAARAADPKLHFVELARLQSDQATGDDAAVCKSILQLAPLLTPAGAQL